MYLLVSFIFIVFLVALLTLCYGDVLFFAQDYSTWQASSLYFEETLQHPGGFLEWCGGWLTQLFYYPILGASILGLLWFFAVYFWIQALHLQGPCRLLPLIPVGLFFGSVVSLGYWLFCSIVPNHWFAPSLAYMLLGFIAWVYSRCGDLMQVLVLSLCVLLGFPLFGWYATLGIGVLMLITTWRRSLIRCLSPFLGVIFSMIILVWYYHNSVSIHWKEPFFLYGIPYVSDGLIISTELSLPILYAAFFVLVLSCIPRVRFTHIWQQWLCCFIAILSAGVYIYGLPSKDAGYYAELQMMRYLDCGQFKSALQIMRHYKEQPTREMVLMKDVALAQLGQLSEHAFDYDIRGIRPTDPNGLSVHIGHSAGPIIYYWYGLPNYAYMWCCDNNIERGYCPHRLRLLYRSCMVNGEISMAKKFRQQLDGMLFNANPEIDENEIRQVRRFMTGNNDLANDDGLCERFLMLRLCTQKYDNPEGQQIALHYAMLMRQPEYFFQALDHYVSMVGSTKPLPRYVGEAYLAFSQGQNSRYQQYQQAVMQRAQRRVPLEAAGAQLYPSWGHTFWWFYDFYTNQDFY